MRYILLIYCLTIAPLRVLCCHNTVVVVMEGDTIPAEGPSGKLTNLGAQVRAAVIRSGTFVEDSRRRGLVYGVVSGKPAHLVGFDVKTRKLVVDLPIAPSSGARGVSASSDGWLYVGGSGGQLFRHFPGSDIVENVGKPFLSESLIWDIVRGKNGEIFGGTYPGCRVFRYHPDDGFSDVGRGALVEGEYYAHNIAYHKVTGKLYVGVGSHVNLIELDPVTGTKRQLLPEEYRGKAGFASPVNVLHDFSDGDRLLATVAGKTLIYNLTKDKLERELPAFDVKSATKSPDDDVIYYTKGGNLYSLDFASPDESPAKHAACAKAFAMRWEGSELYVLNFEKIYTRILRYNAKTERAVSFDLRVPPQPIHIHMTALGPNGKIWTSGYPVGTHAVFDPISGKTENLYGLSQSESMTTANNKLYFGNYPGGRLYRYDAKKKWDAERGNPKLLTVIKGEDRPYGAVSVPELGKIYFGTVPKYGVLGGVLAEYNVGKGTTNIFRDVAQDRSIIKLFYKNGLVFGGTAVSGGLGIKPSEKEAILFGWDPVNNRKVFEVTPVPDANTITCFLNGPDGNLWGMADATLFIFDPSSMKVLSTHTLFEKYKSKLWRDFNLVIHPSGQIYGTGNDQLFRLDPETKVVTTLLQDASLLTMDKQGHLYFVRSDTDLWSYEP